ncbi:hypothetical protein Tco_0647370 [Tanacetum coccineum]
MAPKRWTTRLNPGEHQNGRRHSNPYILSQCQIKEMINECVTDVLAARDATRMAMIAILQETGARRPVQVARNALTWVTIVVAIANVSKNGIMCDQMFPEGVGQDAIEFATELMDKKISTFAERQAENKRKLDNNNFLRGRMWLKLTRGTGEGKSMLELYHCTTSADFVTMGPCTRTLTCYECGKGHYRIDCPKLKNGNQARGTETRGRVFALVGGETNQDLTTGL